MLSCCGVGADCGVGVDFAAGGDVAIGRMGISRKVSRTALTGSRRQLTRVVLFACECATADIISTVEFDHTGDYLATGDKGGRVVLFERNESVSP